MPHPACKKVRRTCGNHSLTNVKGMAAWILGQPWVLKKGAGISARPEFASQPSDLGFKDSHDLERPRIDHEDLVADEDELISAPFRINRHDLPRKRVESHVAWNAGADRDRKVHVVQRLNTLVADHRGDLGALLGRELSRSASLSSRLGLDRRSSLRLGGRLTSLGLRGRLTSLG